MSVHCHCFEGLNIRKCIVDDSCCCRCCGKSKSARNSQRGTPKPSARSPTSNQAKVMMIYDVSHDLSVVSRPHRHVTSLIDNISDEPWDFMIIDKNHRLVMMTGDRFYSFCTMASPSTMQHIRSRSDACRGMKLADLYPKCITAFFDPLIDLSLNQNKSAQLHTTLAQKSLTMFAYPLCNENDDVVGVQIIYLPTTYNKTDIATLITSGTEHPSYSLL